MAAKSAKLKVVTTPHHAAFSGTVSYSHHIRLLGKNSKIVMDTEVYSTRANARRALKRIVELIRDPALEIDEGN